MSQIRNMAQSGSGTSGRAVREAEGGAGTKRKMDLPSLAMDSGVLGSSSSWAISEIGEEPFDFLWIIKNASTVLKGSEDFKSPIFKGGLKSKHQWQMLVQPHPGLPQDVGFYLRLVEFGKQNLDGSMQSNKENIEPKLRVRFEIAIPKCNGAPPLILGCRGGCGKFYDFIKKSRDGSWGNSTQTKDLMDPKNGLIENDTLQLYLRAWIGSDWKHKIGGLCDGPVAKCPRSELSFDMSNLFNDGKFSDVTVSVGSKTFPVHRAILAARSSVFEAMFSNNMIESIKNSVVIEDFAEETVKLMLEYVYTGKTMNLDAHATDLIKIAEKYDIQGLKEDCEYLLVQSLSVANAGELLVLADLYNTRILKEKVIAFIHINKAKVTKTTSFKNVSTAYPNVLLDLYMSQ